MVTYATRIESLGVLAEQLIKQERLLKLLMELPESERFEGDVNCAKQEIAMLRRKMEALV